jgi:hypothetical protein
MFRRRFPLLGLIVLAWAAAIIVVAALTSWWALFALFALFPLAMASSMAVMGATGPAQAGAQDGLWAWCAWWFGSTDRERGQQPTPQH